MLSRLSRQRKIIANWKIEYNSVVCMLYNKIPEGVGTPTPPLGPLVVSIDGNTLVVIGLRSSCLHRVPCIYQRPSIRLFAGDCVIYCEAVNDLDSNILQDLKLTEMYVCWNVG